MSDYTKELHDPAVESHLDDAHLEDNAASSGILLEKADYETGHSPEVTSLASSAILAEKEDEEDDDHVLVANASKPQATKAHSEKAPTTALPTPTTTSTTTSTALATTEDLNQTMPWKLLYPIASRETILSLLKATAINFMLPFINGVFLGFGEICAHELAFRWGWTNSTHVVNPAGRPRVANVGIRAGGTSASGGRSGIGGLGAYEDEINNKTTSTTTYSY